MNPQQAPNLQQPAPQLNDTIPAIWPDDSTGKGLYKYSKNAVSNNIWPLLVLFIWSFGDITPIKENNLRILIAIYILGLCVHSLFAGALATALLDSVDGKKPSMKRSFGTSFRLIHKLAPAAVLVAFSTLIGFVLFIIPGIIVALRLMLTNYYIVEQKMGPIAAMKASLAATKGNFKKLSQIAILNVLIVLLAFTIIGIPFAVYFLFMFSAASAILYRFLNNGPSSYPGLSPAAASAQAAQTNIPAPFAAPAPVATPACSGI